MWQKARHNVESNCGDPTICNSSIRRCQTNTRILWYTFNPPNQLLLLFPLRGRRLLHDNVLLHLTSRKRTRKGFALVFLHRLIKQLSRVRPPANSLRGIALLPKELSPIRSSRNPFQGTIQRMTSVKCPSLRQDGELIAGKAKVVHPLHSVKPIVDEGGIEGREGIMIANDEKRLLIRVVPAAERNKGLAWRNGVPVLGIVLLRMKGKDDNHVHSLLTQIGTAAKPKTPKEGFLGQSGVHANATPLPSKTTPTHCRMCSTTNTVGKRSASQTGEQSRQEKSPVRRMLGERGTLHAGLLCVMKKRNRDEKE